MPEPIPADSPAAGVPVAIVTGASSGLGLATASALAGMGMEVILAARNEERAAAAMAQIRAQHPAARLRFTPLDLASLASVRGFVAQFAAPGARLDLLVNNAGVMAIPRRQLSVDGFEMQLASNYIGHFALTLGLLPLLIAPGQPAARVISLGSLAARGGRIAFEDIHCQRFYNGWAAYAQTKLACVMFALELARRARLRNWPLISAAAHPGWSVTNLQSAGPSMGLGRKSIAERGMRLFEPLFAQSAEAGAQPQIFAATDGSIRSGDYVGPDGFGELTGKPRLVRPPLAAISESRAARLWEMTEAMTGLTLPG